MAAETLFITDFDGTLLTDEKKIHSNDIETLAHLQQKKVMTVIATGRSLYSFKKAVKTLDLSAANQRLPVDYVIFSTGAGIFDMKTGKIIFKKAIENDQVKQIVCFLDARALDYMILKAIPDTRFFLYRWFGQDNPDFHRRIALYEPFATQLSENCRYSGTATEVLVILPREKGLKKIKSIRAALADFSVIHATSPLDHQSVWIEIFHPSVSKSKAAAVLAQKVGVKQLNTVCVGNDYNDQDLLDWAGKSFLVKNGPQTLKNRYPVVASNNACGVAGAARAAGLMD